MHSDLDTFDPTQSPIPGLDSTSPTPFLILGAGIAGLVLATRLATLGHQVTLLEAGGLDPAEPPHAHPPLGDHVPTHADPDRIFVRTLGGLSTRWGGQLLPYPPEVLAAWPIAAGSLEPFYPEVEALMHVGALPFTDDLLPALGHPKIPFAPGFRLRYSKWAPFTRRNLAQTLGREALTHPRIHLLTHASVRTLHVSNSTVSGVTVQNRTGQIFTLHAEQVILAAGTVECSRLLLASPEIPNPHDQLGRFFHDHVGFHAATLSPTVRKPYLERFGPFFTQGTLHTPKIEAARALHLPADVMAHFVIEEPADSGTAAVRNLLTALQRGRLKQALTRNLLPLVRGTADVARLLLYRQFRRRRAVSARATVYLNIDLEQPADAQPANAQPANTQSVTPENRITLRPNPADPTHPLAHIDYRIGPAEHTAARQYAHLIRAEFARLGLPDLTWLPYSLEGPPPPMVDTYHAMGGLRMGPHPQTSVVDANLKHHQLTNLHIASCATYPTGGSSNPTFTLIALTLRLAQHLTQTTST